MPIRSIFVSTVILAVACGGLPVPSHAADPDGGPPGSRWQPVADRDVEEPSVTRDLRPSKPGRTAGRPRVTLRPSSPVVAVGRPIKFEVGSSVDGFGHIYVLSASGRVQVWMENVPITAGRHTWFPTGKLRIKAVPPAGKEDVILIVTRGRINGFLGEDATRTPRDLSYDPYDFKQAVRDKFEDLPRRDWGYARALVEVISRAAGESDDEWGWRPEKWR